MDSANKLLGDKIRTNVTKRNSHNEFVVDIINLMKEIEELNNIK